MKTLLVLLLTLAAVHALLQHLQLQLGVDVGQEDVLGGTERLGQTARQHPAQAPAQGGDHQDQSGQEDEEEPLHAAMITK